MHPLNAQSPMDFSPAPSFSSFSDVQPMKAQAPISTALLRPVTSESFSQFSKARPPSSVTFFKAILVSPDPENADCPIFVILEISIDCNDFAFKKMLSGSSVTKVYARFISVSLNAPENAETPSVVSVSGSETSVMYSIPLNANSPISVTLFPTSALFNRLQNANACPPISSTPSGMIMPVRLSQE